MTHRRSEVHASRRCEAIVHRVKLTESGSAPPIHHPLGLLSASLVRGLADKQLGIRGTVPRACELTAGPGVGAATVSEAEKLRKQVATLASFGRHALRSSNVGELLQEATLLISDAIEIDLVKVLEILPDGQNLLVRAGVNWDPGVVGHATIPADDGSAAGHALHSDAPVISEIATESRFKIPTLLLEHGVKSTVNVVIRGDRGPFGVLEVDSRQPRSFGQDDIDFLSNYANLLASAIDRVNKQNELEGSIREQEVLLHELHHRVNNMLMTISAVARLTRAKSKDVDEFAKALDDRLKALARSHALLGQPGRTTATIGEILSQELLAQGGVESGNLSQRGPQFPVPSKQAQLLSMAFHELATNAVKHGALSDKAGRIDVVWGAERTQGAQHVRIRWREHGVTINHAPLKRGFGSEILEKSIPEMLQGSFNRTFHPDGVECVFEFSIEG
jgi:two-component sensor histidine kinase